MKQRLRLSSDPHLDTNTHGSWSLSYSLGKLARDQDTICDDSDLAAYFASGDRGFVCTFT
jgi:hypothetical protein